MPPPSPIARPAPQTDSPSFEPSEHSRSRSVGQILISRMGSSLARGRAIVVDLNVQARDYVTSPQSYFQSAKPKNDKDEI